jgi:ABC-type multidrug transport system permease subunit
MRFVLTCATKDFRRVLSDPLALLLWLGLPLAIGGMIWLAGGAGSGGQPRAHVLVADLDSTFLSGLLLGAGEQEGAAEILELEPVALEDGRGRIGAGEATALLIIPEGFQQAVLEETPAELLLLTNPAQTVLPAIVEEGLEILVEGTFYLQRVFGDELQLLAAGPPTGQNLFADTIVASLSLSVNQRLQQLESTLLPPVLDVSSPVSEGGEAEGSASAVDFGLLFLPGILFMALLFVAQGMSDDVWEEKMNGTLRRALVSPGPAGGLLGGKLLAGAAVAAFTSVVGLAVAVSLFDVPPPVVPAALVWCTFAGTALLVFFQLAQLFATTQRGATVLTTALVFPLMMVGGSFFPFEVMPDWMAAVGRWTPNGLAVVQLKALLRGDAETVHLARAALGIGVPAALALLISSRRLAGRFAVNS